MKTAIGVDVGGTKISITVGNERGRLLFAREIPTRVGPHARDGIRDLLAQLQATQKAFQSKAKLLGIGIGIPGPVNTRKGIVPFSPHLGGWEGIPLQRRVEKATGLKTFMANDANAAALGEKYFGQGKGVDDFVYMTVSTGIGGGVVMDGKLVEGVSFVAGEVGHMTIVPDGEKCKCGKLGCLEAYASGTALAKFADRKIKAGQAPGKIVRMALNEPVTAQKLGILARQGNAFALDLYRRSGFYLGVGVANLLNILNPQKVILGGGVLKSSPSQFWSSMMASCKANAWPEAMKAVKIVPSRLHGHAGDLGALALVFEKIIP